MPSSRAVDCCPGVARATAVWKTIDHPSIFANRVQLMGVERMLWRDLALTCLRLLDSR